MIRPDDPRVLAAQAALSPIHYVGPATIAKIIDAADHADAANGVRRVLAGTAAA